MAKTTKNNHPKTDRTTEKSKNTEGEKSPSVSQSTAIAKVEEPVIENIDLTELHAEPTNNDVAPETVIEENNITQEETSKIDEPTAAEKKEEENAQNNSEAGTNGESENDKESEKDNGFLSPQLLAEYTLIGINLLHEGLLPKAYLSSMFTKEERKIIRQINNGELVIVNEYTTELKSRYEDYLALNESIPLTDEESKNLKKALVRYFKTVDFKMTPEMALLSSIAVVSGIRILPIISHSFPKLLEKIMSKIFSTENE